ncbi:MAG: helicase C-terminal domain-containing protein [Spirochaetota bacterium]
MRSVHHYFTQELLQFIRNEIADAQNNEVLFFGRTDSSGKVAEAEVVSRGHHQAVAVPLNRTHLPDVVIHNHPDGRLIPSDNDLRVSSYAAQKGVGFFIIDNGAQHVYVVNEIVKKHSITHLDPDELISMVSEGGCFSRAIPGFEERVVQKQMIQYVCRSFNQDHIALIEAGTGTGKSIAYLFPAVVWSVKNRERVIISTNTINLQEQLLYKDLPDLKKTLGYDFSYVLMKGRGNYICINKVYEITQELFSFLDDKEMDQFRAVVKWMEKTQDGSLSDLGFLPSASLWEKLNSQAETCMGNSCRYFNQCFLNRVKREAAHANIVVTNHHYLLADANLIGSGGAILPEFDRVIFDEAHNLEDSATSFFTRSVTLSRLIRVLNGLYSAGGKKGYLPYLFKTGSVKKNDSREKLVQGINRLKSSTFELFGELNDFLQKAQEQLTANAGQQDFSVIEVNERLFQQSGRKNLIKGSMKGFYQQCSAVLSRLADIREELNSEEEEQKKKRMDGFIFRLAELIESLDIFLDFEDQKYVRWFERKKETGLFVSLIEVGELVYDLVFKRVKSSVLTSATLAVGGSFDFIKNRLFLKDSETEVQLASPFHMDRQMKVLLSTDIPEPGAPEYSSKLAPMVLEILKAAGGKAFVLFTSYRLLNEVYDKLKEQLTGLGIAVFKQGNDSRRNLLEGFKYNINSILFGTESFWEGVDAPGRTLECVIITKLPFKVPTEPIIRARLERIRKKGGNPFIQYSLPLAVIKMKQGMGRLIRNKTDRGIVAILDRRVVVRSYGSVFISSMPTRNIFKGPQEQLVDEVKAFQTNNSLTN